MKNLEDCTVCRLCLDIVSNHSEGLQSIKRDMQEFILPEIDLDLTCEPKTCKKCSDNLHTCYEFKSICLKNSRDKKHIIESVSVLEKIMDVDPQPSTVKQQPPKCCLCQIAIDTLEELPARGGDHFLKTMLKKCLPEIAFQKFSPPCENCLDCLENLFMFTTSCLNAEENIKSYCFTKGIHNQSKIDLHDVYCFIQSSIKTENDTNSKVIYSEGDDTQAVTSEDSCDSFIKPELEEGENGCCEKKETNLGNNVEKEEKTNRKKRQDTKHLKTELNDKECPEGTSTIHKCTKCETNGICNMKSHSVINKNPSKIIAYNCNKCTYKSKYKSNFNMHRLLHRNSVEITMHKCTLCKFETKYKRTLKAHSLKHKSHLDVQVYSCDMCKYETLNKYSFKRHNKVHLNPSKVIESKSELLTLDQFDVKMYTCNTCEYQTKHKYYLEKHNLVHKEPSEVVTSKCDLCSYETTQKKDFKRHMLRHKRSSEIMVYKCRVCKFKTKHKFTLETHMLRHKDIKMYSCNLCKYETKNKSHFLDHGLVHKDPSEIKMFKCHVCSHETKRKRDLNKHILRHTKS